MSVDHGNHKEREPYAELTRRDFIRSGSLGAAVGLAATHALSVRAAVATATTTKAAAAGAVAGPYDSTFIKIVGPLGPALCAFTEDEKVDLESTTKWVEWQVAAGIPLIWTTYGTTHYMALTDDEILALNRAIAGVTRNRAVFVASTNYNWPVRKCLEFIEQMRAAGADAVKLQLDWSLNPS